MHVAYNHCYTVILFASKRETTNTANNLTCNTLQNHTRVECTHQNHPNNMQRSMHGPFTSSHGMKSFNLMPRCLKPHDVEYGGTQVKEIRLQTTDAATKPPWCDDPHHQTQRAGSSQGTTNGWSLHSNDAANYAKLLCFGNVAWCVGMERWWMVPFIPTACFGQISPSSFNNTNSWTCDHWDWVPPQDLLTTKWHKVMPVNSSENLSSMFRSSERNLYECHASSPQSSTKHCLGKKSLLTTVDSGTLLVCYILLL